MTIAAMKRSNGSGIDDLIRDYKPQPLVEPPSPIVVVGEDKFGAVLENYLCFLDEYDWLVTYRSEIRQLKDAITAVLHPEEINQFLQLTTLYSDHERWRNNTGIYVTKLLENSVKAGNKEFIFDATTLPRKINFLASDLYFKKKGVKLIIHGDVGDYCGHNIDFLDLSVYGNAKTGFGGGARKSRLYCSGNVGGLCGTVAKNSFIEIEGHVGEDYGQGARDTTFVFRSTVENTHMFSEDRAAIDCTFKTPNNETFQKLQRFIDIRYSDVVLMK